MSTRKIYEAQASDAVAPPLALCEAGLLPGYASGEMTLSKKLLDRNAGKFLAKSLAGVAMAAALMHSPAAHAYTHPHAQNIVFDYIYGFDEGAPEQALGPTSGQSSIERLEDATHLVDATLGGVQRSVIAYLRYKSDFPEEQIDRDSMQVMLGRVREHISARVDQVEARIAYLEGLPEDQFASPKVLDLERKQKNDFQEMIGALGEMAQAIESGTNERVSDAVGALHDLAQRDHLFPAESPVRHFFDSDFVRDHESIKSPMRNRSLRET